MTLPGDESDDDRTEYPTPIPAGQEPSTLEIARQIARDTLAADHRAVELNTQVVHII